MNAKVYDPWLSFKYTEEFETFKAYCESNNINICDEHNDETSHDVQISGDYSIGELSEMLNEDIERWENHYHPEILRKEYTQIALVLSQFAPTEQDKAKRLEEVFKASIDTLESGYVQICTHFFQYTVFFDDGLPYLSSEVEVFVKDEPACTVYVKVNKCGMLSINDQAVKDVGLAFWEK